MSKSGHVWHGQATMRHYHWFLHSNVGNVAWVGMAWASSHSTLSSAELITSWPITVEYHS